MTDPPSSVDVTTQPAAGNMGSSTLPSSSSHTVTSSATQPTPNVIINTPSPAPKADSTSSSQPKKELGPSGSSSKPTRRGDSSSGPVDESPPIDLSVLDAQDVGRKANHLMHRLQFLSMVQAIAKQDVDACCQVYGQTAVSGHMNRHTPISTGYMGPRSRSAATGTGGGAFYPSGSYCERSSRHSLGGAGPGGGPPPFRPAGRFNSNKTTSNQPQPNSYQRTTQFGSTRDHNQHSYNRPPSSSAFRSVDGTQQPAKIQRDSETSNARDEGTGSEWKTEPPQREKDLASSSMSGANNTTTQLGNSTKSQGIATEGSTPGVDSGPGVEVVLRMLNEQQNEIQRLLSLVEKPEDVQQPLPHSPHQIGIAGPSTGMPPMSSVGAGVSSSAPAPITHISEIPAVERQKINSILAQDFLRIHKQLSAQEARTTQQTQTVMDCTTQTSAASRLSSQPASRVPMSLTSSMNSINDASMVVEPPPPLLAQVEQAELLLSENGNGGQRQEEQQEALDQLRDVYNRVQNLLFEGQTPPNVQQPQQTPSSPVAHTTTTRPSSHFMRHSAIATSERAAIGPSNNAGELASIVGKLELLERQTDAVAERLAKSKSLTRTKPTPAAHSSNPSSVSTSVPNYPPQISTLSSIPTSVIAITSLQPVAAATTPNLGSPALTYPLPPLENDANRMLFVQSDEPQNTVFPASRHRKRRPRGFISPHRAIEIRRRREEYVNHVKSLETSWNTSAVSQYDFAERITDEILDSVFTEVLQEFEGFMDEFVDKLMAHEAGQ